MALKNDEIFEVFGELLLGVAAELREDDDTPGELTKSEIWKLIEQFSLKAIKEIVD